MGKSQGSWKKKSLLALPLVAFAYVGVLAWFVAKEDSYVFIPRPGLRNADSLHMGIEQVKLKTIDDAELVCWIIPALKRDSSGSWLLYLHGNGGNISSRGYISHYRTFASLGLNTFAVGYRGYGLSSGTPSEQGFYIDAKTAYDYLVNDRRIPPSHIVVFGYSLGSAVATELATRIDAGGLILEGAFTSLPDAGGAQYPFLPTNLMMKNRFNSIDKMEHVAGPKLFLHATNDEVIPFPLGKELFEAASEPKTFLETRGGHNTAHTEDSAKFYGAITQFIESVKRYHR